MKIVEDNNEIKCKRTYIECKNGEKIFFNGLADGLSKAYKQGLEEAWETAREIACCNDDGGIGQHSLKEIFKTDRTPDIINKFSAEEAIEKIKTYEEQKKAEEEIKIGDEIVSCGQKSVVTGFHGYTYTEISAITHTGFGVKYRLSDVKKTGRHFPQIEEVLKEMESGEGGGIPFM